MEGTTQKVEDVTNVLFFLLFRKREAPGDMWGGIKVEEAFDSAARLSFPGCNPREVEDMLASFKASTY